MKIKSFNQFISEKINPQPDDSETLKSAKNFYNEEESIIQKFNADKVELQNIYLSYTNEEDLINRLLNKKFVEEKTSDPEKMKFTNKYLQKLASLAKKNRELKDLETIVMGNNKDLETYKQTVADNKGNDTVINDTQTKVDKSTERLKNNQDRIKELESEIRDLDRQIRKDMDELKARHIENRQKIREEESKRNSFPADTSQGESEEVEK